MFHSLYFGALMFLGLRGLNSCVRVTQTIRPSGIYKVQSYVYVLSAVMPHFKKASSQ
jgi:hypothetical protein